MRDGHRNGLCFLALFLYFSPLVQAQWTNVSTATPVTPLAFADVPSAKNLSGGAEKFDVGIESEPPLPTPRWLPDGTRVDSTGAIAMPGAAHSEYEKATVTAPPIDIGFQALPQGTISPPDTNGAAGPDHLMTMLNDRVRYQSHDGTEISTNSLSAFWAPLVVSSPFDPKTIYDPFSDRFIAVALSNRRSTSSAVLLAVSKTSDPTAGWFLWKFRADPVGLLWADYSYVGISDDKITFSTNLFTVAADIFSRVAVFVVDKATVLDGDPITSSRIDTSTIANLAPCLTYDAGIGTQYLVAVGTANFANQGTLNIYRVTASALSAVLELNSSTAKSAPWNLSLISAPQGGTGTLIATNDDRVMNAVYRNGSIWTALTVFLPAGAPTSFPTRTGAKWWEVDPELGETNQSGVIEDPFGDFFYYFPTLSVNASDDVLVGFSGSSSSSFVGAYYAYRDGTSPVSEISEATLLKAGEGSFSGPRWGDYSATMVDPVDDDSFWTIQEYADAGDRWATWWGRIESTTGPPDPPGPPEPPDPPAGPLDGPVSWWWLLGATVPILATGLAVVKRRSM